MSDSIQSAAMQEQQRSQSASSILLWALLAVYLVFQISFWWKRRNLYIQSWNVPGPLCLPVIGMAYIFMPCGPDEIYDKLVELQVKFKRDFKLWFGPKLLYFLATPKHIDKVLTSPIAQEKDELYKHVIYVTGTGLLPAPLALWKPHRKAIAPSFNQKVLDSFVDIFAEKSLIFSEILERHVDEELDIFKLISRCTLDIILETAMGVKMDIQNGNSDYGEVLDRIMELTSLKIFKIWNHIDPYWHISSSGREMRKLLKRWNDFIDKIIQEKLQRKFERRSSLVAQVEDVKKHTPFLDRIIETDAFSPKELRDEVCIFIIAGTDTTAATLSFLFSILGIYPEVQQKVYEEVVEIMGHDRQPLPSDLPLMKYTEKVIKETLRFFPVGAFFLRAITEDLDLGDFVLPAGSSAFFGTYYLHRNPEVWKDPLKFDPERFSPENAEKIPQGAYLPFSLGPRGCIGMKYAMMNMKTAVATVVRKLKFRSEYKSAADVEVKTNIVMRYKNRTKLYVEKREQ